MKDPSDNIRDWVYNVLYGTVFYNGTAIGVYSFPPKDQSKPYILIAEQFMSGEQGTKDCYITEHDVTIEIYDSSSGNDASYVRVNSICDSVLQLLRQRAIETSGSGGATISTITGFNAIRILADTMVTDRITDGTNNIIYKSLNIRLLLEEN